MGFVELVAEHGEPDASEGPVDVEPVRMLRPAAVAQQVPPRRVLVGTSDAGVVGHDVDDHLEAT